MSFICSIPVISTFSSFGNRFCADSVPDLTAIEDLHLPGSILQHLGYSANHTFNT
jgi:hypothetical protein